MNSKTPLARTSPSIRASRNAGLPSAANSAQAACSFSIRSTTYLARLIERFVIAQASGRLLSANARAAAPSRVGS